MAENNRPVALVTGASRGLGLALARELARRDWALVVDAREADPLATAAAELRRWTVVHAITGDVTDARHRAELRRAVETLGGLDALVNSAGTLGPSPLPPMLEFPPAALAALFRVNVAAPLALVQELWPLLRPEACVLSVTSDAAVEAYPGWGGYGASKAALERLTAVLAAEHPSRRIYAVDPGDMRTRMHQEAFPGEDISDRPPPEASVPGILRLLTGHLPSGRYQARALEPAAEAV